MFTGVLWKFILRTQLIMNNDDMYLSMVCFYFSTCSECHFLVVDASCGIWVWSTVISSTDWSVISCAWNLSSYLDYSFKWAVLRAYQLVRDKRRRLVHDKQRLVRDKRRLVRGRWVLDCWCNQFLTRTIASEECWQFCYTMKERSRLPNCE